MERTIIGAKFKLGTVVATRGVMAHIEDNAGVIFPYLKRHAKGDWGDACAEDKKTNEEALQIGNRLMSVYKLKDGKKIWIITEWDRSITTVLFPDEY